MVSEDIVDQGCIMRAEEEGLINRKEGASEHGQLPPVFNYITQKEIELLLKSLRL
jgi:hypothetical protein